MEIVAPDGTIHRGLEENIKAYSKGRKNRVYKFYDEMGEPQRTETVGTVGKKPVRKHTMPAVKKIKGLLDDQGMDINETLK